MNDKPFYVDNSIGLRKTYADLLSDVSLIQKIPSVFGSDNYYQLFTLMIAAIYSDAELALSQDPLYDTEMSGMGAQTTAVSRIRVTELANTIVRSECKIGVFTSGTTGRPRLIQHRTETLIRSVRANDHHRDDVWGLTYHPASFAGLQVFFQAVFNINPLINLTGLNARTVNKTIQNQNITHISATPTWMRLACSDEAVHQQVRHITTGGEIADCALIEQIERKFPNAEYRNVYASTESGSLLISHGDSFQIPANLTDRVKVANGQLVIHRSLMAESLRGESQDEFFVTGDCVEVVSIEPLTLRITTRKNDWINVGGYKVNPYEIEALLVAVEGVADARVFGRKNSVTGNIVCCEIVRSAYAVVTIAAIRKRLEEFVPSYKIPRIFDFVKAIAKTHSGKKNRAL